MSWFPIVGGVIDYFKDKKVAEHSETMKGLEVDAQTLKQFTEEFKKSHKNPIIAFLNGLVDFANRLPRPVLVFTVFYIFYLAYTDPDEFAIIVASIAAIPEGLWVLMSIIVGFYFGGRMQLKGQDFKFNAKALEKSQKAIAEIASKRIELAEKQKIYDPVTKQMAFPNKELEQDYEKAVKLQERSSNSLVNKYANTSKPDPVDFDDLYDEGDGD